MPVLCTWMMMRETAAPITTEWEWATVYMVTVVAPPAAAAAAALSAAVIVPSTMARQRPSTSV